MPYKSDAQRRWAHTATGEKALGGKAAVHEWDEATKGKKIPEKVSKAELPANPSKIGSSLGSILGSSIPQGKNPINSGKQSIAVKTPKPKKQINAFASPSVFFQKSEDFEGPKHPSLRNLWNFMNKKHKK